MIQIIVPVNFSEYAINALNFALNLGLKLQSEITIIYCQPPLTAINNEETEEELSRDEAHERLRLINGENEIKLRHIKADFEKKLAKLHNENVKLKIDIQTGYPEDVLIAISEMQSPDVIVMGTKSKGETIKELLGSVTSDVIKNAKVPVLAVPAQSSIHLKEINRVLFVTDFGNSDYRSLHKLIRLLEPFETKIYAIHFTTSEPDKWDKKKLEEMRYYCETTYRKYHIDFDFITGESFIESLDSMIIQKGINLIAMTRRKRNLITTMFHPSFTRKILFHTDIPLLVFHE